jgi:hypothetical protein
MLAENDSSLTVNVWFLKVTEHTPHTERGKDVLDTNCMHLSHFYADLHDRLLINQQKVPKITETKKPNLCFL